MAWGLCETPFIVCPMPGEELLRQHLSVEGYLIKPVSEQTINDILRQCGQTIDRILVVDDDKDFVRLLSRLLDNSVRRYQILAAHTGQEGLHLLERQRPDLVLLDLGLPDMDGLQLLDRMRANPSWRDIPLVIVTGRDEMGDSQVLQGGLFVTRASGLKPGEMVQWIQKVVETVTQKQPQNT